MRQIVLHGWWLVFLTIAVFGIMACESDYVRKTRDEDSRRFRDLEVKIALMDEEYNKDVDHRIAEFMAMTVMSSCFIQPEKKYMKGR